MAAIEAAYYVVVFQTTFATMEEVMKDAPNDLVSHVKRSHEWHAAGRLLMAGAFLDHPEQPVSTMAVLASREAAEEFAAGDPFVEAGTVSSFEVRPWADIFRMAPD